MLLNFLTPKSNRKTTAHVSLVTLITPSLYEIKNTLKKASKSWQLPFFSLLAIACLAGCYWAGHFLFSQLMRVDFIAELLMQKTIGFILDFFKWILIFSTLIATFASHYLAQDLPRLIHAPISARRLFYARSIQAWAQTSWMILLFALPTLMNSGVLLDASWFFYLSMPLCLFILTLYTSSIACGLALILARLFPAKRIQELLVILLVAVFIYFYIKLHASRPDRFFKEDGFQDVVEMVNQLKSLGDSFSIAGLCSDAIFASIKGDFNRWFIAMSPLIAGLITLIIILGFIAESIYLPGYWLAQEGIGNVNLKPGKSRIPKYAATIHQAIRKRETLIFWRSPSQWTQLLLVGSLVIVYFFNFKYFHILHKTGFFTNITLVFTHMGLCGMIFIMLASRFLFPSISTEGKALWVIQSAPITAFDLLYAKIKWARPPMLILAIAMSILSAWLTDLSWPWMIVSFWSSLMIAWAIVSLGISMGAAQPRFNLSNPAMVASSLGGIAFMLVAGLYLFIFMGLCYYPSIVLVQLQSQDFQINLFNPYIWESQYIMAVLSLLLLHLMHGTICVYAVRWGGTRLEKVMMSEVRVI